ncbi:radical SAM protein [Nitrospirillum sp. BR 11163]|uniref:radical SAM protein n=1 Tax=Nitrospirillum sp. BR 11163 TaxID=3104323 RepID=UPI002B001B7E|nr:radical SAM protein [Nitrospirillum sp. BR 11163]MEA1676159.1 radical SAM protein [Nitrospirillum sp. BR 11163]
MSVIMKTKVRRIEVIVKITERCNINCTYCYFFNMNNDDYKRHPIHLPLETAESIADFLRQGVIDLGAEAVTIDMHGGEPLMIKKDAFIAICDIFSSRLDPICHLQFKVQTNGMLVDDEWISIFSNYNFSIGVSIDGPRDYNDLERVDHRGRGTYDGTAAGVAKLQAAASAQRIGRVGALCVINPRFDARRTYRHFVDDLGFTGMDFLLPLDDHDSFDPAQAENYGRYLCDLFDEWTADDNPAIQVRILKNALIILSQGRAGVRRIDDEYHYGHQALTISSNGDIGPDDTLRATSGNFFESGVNVANTPLIDFINRPMFQELAESRRNLPAKCQECCWKNACRGGRPINRFSAERRFDNPSVICDGLQDFFSHVAAYLLRHGLSYERLQEALGLLEAA